MSISSQVNPEPEQPVTPTQPTEPAEHQPQTPDTSPAEPEVKESAPLAETQWTTDGETPGVTTTPASSAPSATPVSTSPPATEPSTKSAYDNLTDNLLARMGDVGQTKSYFKILIYGEPGSTKSSFLGTVPNNFIYDVEDGLIAIKNAERNHGLNRAPGSQSLPYKSFFQFTEIVNRFKDNIPQLEPFEVFSVDTMSELHKRGLQETTERAHRNSPTQVNEFVAETEQHTENNERITRMVRSLRDMDRNLIIICHARTVEPKNRPSKTYPDFSEKLANSLMSFMDVVGYMHWDEVDGVATPILQTVGGNGIAAKNRMGLPPKIANPNYPAMKAAWEKLMLADGKTV